MDDAGGDALLIRSANLPMPGPDGQPLPNDAASSLIILNQVQTCALPPDSEEASSEAAAPAPVRSGSLNKGTQPPAVANEDAFYAALQRVAADGAAGGDWNHTATILLQGAP